MRRLAVLLAALALGGSSYASWYWPFGDDDDESSTNKVERVRLSALMEPATLLIDEAADLAGDGKIQDSVDKYRAALVELDRIEQEHAARAKTSEFATLRNKRAYVNAAIDSLLLKQAHENDKSVAVSDTTELEKRLAEEKAAAARALAESNAVAKAEGETKAKIETEEETKTKTKIETEEETKTKTKKEAKVKTEAVAEIKEEVKVPKKARPKRARPKGRREQVLQDIADKDFNAAEIGIRAWLEETPNNAPALNLLAALEAERGNFKAAEQALDRAIESNPRSHYAYYNMAQLLMERDKGSKTVARRYYETGRALGGPEDAQLEEMFR